MPEPGKIDYVAHEQRIASKKADGAVRKQTKGKAGPARGAVQFVFGIVVSPPQGLTREKTRCQN
jgi:hypothetical protein